ncbi:MAG: hypothetical protein EBT22_13150 [Chloroflexi bacterium]|nr:hypothetical protein [Chloroflexota bacterium]
MGDGPFPAVMICHENAGTAEHFRDVARRFAKVGYVAIHLDLLSREGGTEAVPANQRAAALTAPGKAELFVDDFRAAMAMLRADPGVRGDAIGMTGYCFGGSVTWNVACREPGLRAAVPFYGPPGFPEELGEIRASCLGVYGDLDARVNASIPVVETHMTCGSMRVQVTRFSTTRALRYTPRRRRCRHGVTRLSGFPSTSPSGVEKRAV